MESKRPITLPRRSEYYRPTRARALSEKAAELEWWYHVLHGGAAVCFVLMVCAGVGCSYFGRAFTGLALVGVALFVVPAPPLTLFGLWAMVVARRCREEAADLYREHSARHGTL